MKARLDLVLLALVLGAPGAFAATLTFSSSAPTATPDAISNFVGATFDADNVGGSGANASGSPNNGTANDGITYVATNRPAQGQTFTTGANPGGYTISSITVRMPGYTNNIATGGNTGAYTLSNTGSTFYVRVGRISGTTFIPYTVEYARSGGTGTPGTGATANGPGTYLTFTFNAPIILQPNTVYAFDIGTSGDYFELLGIRDAASGGNPYSTGTAYTTGANGAAGGTITTQTGDRVFQVNLTAETAPAPGTFVHPGLLSTEADFERMRTNVAMGVEPWLSNYNALKSSWMANTGWPSHAQATITRGSFNDSSRLYNDIAVAYSCALVWKISGDTAYADEAVRILNAWAYTFTSIAGDTNVALNELYGCQFAVVAEMMRNYQGWAAADLAQFQTMIYNVFYSLADSFLTSHFGTGDSHYWANWDLASMSTLYAIGVLNDDTDLVTRSLNYFYSGVGNGCIDRAVNFIHPGYLGQGQEMGRDQGHATLDIAQLAAYCQMAWNQGTDLFGYENNRVLAMAEYTAKYNLGNDVPWTNYGYDFYWPTVWLQTSVASGSRGPSTRPGWPTLYNHYVNLLGMSAPNVKQTADAMGTGWGFNGDSLGWDQLTTALPPIASGTNPSALSAVLNGQQPQLSWWGSAYATSYKMKRSTTPGGPYTTIASGVATNTYTDTNPVAGVTNYYVVTGSLSGGSETGASNETAAILGAPILTQLNFNETSGTTAADSTGNGWSGTLVNGATWSSGKNSNAVNLSKASSQYVSLPAGIVADVSDMTVSAWVYQTSASNNARIFDFGSGDNFYGGWSPWNYPTWLPERYLYLAPQDGNGKVRFGISRSTSVGEESILGASALPTGQWVHVTVTLSAGIGTLYVNGVAVGQNLKMPMTPMQFPPTTQNYIGKSQYRGDPYFDGKIDDFRIYRGALTTGSAYTLATGLAPAAPAPAPATFTVAAQVGNSMVLNWSASSGAASYTVRRSTTSGGPYTAIASLLAGTTYTDSGLTAGTTYYYVVDAANTGGDGAYSTAGSAVALPPLPSAPTGLIAASASSTSVGLIWTAASNATSYNIKRSPTSGGSYTTVMSGVTATSYTNTGLTDGTTYYYVVSAVNAAGESGNSNESGAAPSNLLLQLKFDESSGTTAYDSTGHGWNATTLNSAAWTTGTLGNAISLVSSSSQYVTIPTGVVSGLGDFTVSAWVKMTSQATWQRVFDFGTGTATYLFLTTSNGSVPRFAIKLNGGTEQGINGTAALATGAWAHLAVTLSGSTGKLYVNGTVVGTNTAMTLSPSSLGSTTQNYIGRSEWSADPYFNGLVDDFRIYTRALGSGEISGLVSAPLAAPQNVVATSGYQQIALAWNAVPNATSYTLRSGTVSSGPYTTLASGLTSTGFTQTGLSGSTGTVYYYVVSAVNALGEGPNSAEVSGSALATPGAPVGLTATAGNASAVLNWTLSSDATSYNVYRSESSGTDYTMMASGLTGTTYSDTGLTNGLTYYYVITGVNAGGEGPSSAEASANPMAPPAITSPISASGTVGSAFSYQITASNEPTSYGASGLPAWLSVDTSTGVISGTPTATGTFTPTITATNVGGTGSATLTISVQSGSATVSLTSGAAQDGYIRASSSANTSGGTAYPTTDPSRLGDDNQHRQYKAILSFDTSSIPDNAVVTSATLTFKRSGLTGTNPFTILGTCYADIKGGTGFSGSTTLVAADFQATADATKVATMSNPASNGSSSSGTLNATGLGYINKTGTTQFRVYFSTSTNNNSTSDYISWYTGDDGTAANRPTLQVTYDLVSPPAITSATSATGTYGNAFSYQITATNGPTSYGASGLPSWLSVNTSTGVISGTPTAIGTFTPTITATNGGGTGSATLTITVLPQPPAAPAGLTATGGNRAVALSWNASSGATSYSVWRSTTSGSGYTPLAGGTTTETTYSESGLNDGTTYYYVVRALNAGGSSGNSNEAGATTYTAIQNWRLVNFHTIANSGNAADTADPDGDGMTNAQEYAAGTDPNNPASALKISRVQPSGNDMLVSFPTVSGKSYRLDWSATMQSGSWTVVQDNIAGTGGTVQITDIGGAAQPKRFYRILVY